MNIAYPYSISYNGLTAVADLQEHINDLVEQVLFTMPGERVNQPTFGSALSQLVFAPNSSQLTSTYQSLVQGALQQWLGDLIQVQSITTNSTDSTLEVTLQYTILSNQQQQVTQFTQTF